MVTATSGAQRAGARPFGGALRRSDAALALGLAAVSAIEAVAFRTSPFEIVTAALAPLALAWRRRHPLVAPLVPPLFFWSQGIVGYPADDVMTPLIVVALCAYSLAVHAGPRRWAGLAVLVVEVATVIAGNPLTITGEDAVFGSVPVLGGFVAGVVSGSRGRRAVSAEERASQVEQRADDERRAAVAAERLRIARDLHDLLAHSVSVMVVQAGAAQQVLHSDPDAADTAMTTVQDVGRRALAETGALVGLLRDGGADVELTPAPRLADLGELIEDVGRAGLVVTLQQDGSPGVLTRSSELSAYRVVQEALTNVLRHSRAETAHVALRWEPDELYVAVADDGPAVELSPRAVDPGAGGHGLIGMRERVALVGGSLEAGSDGDGFRVQIRLPLVSTRS